MTLDQTASLFIGAISGIGVAILQETAQTRPVMQAVRSVIEPRRAFARGVGFLENMAYGQGREATRMQRAEALLRPASAIGPYRSVHSPLPLLERIANEQAMQRQIAQYGTGMAGGLSAYLGGVTGRNVGGR